MKKRFIPILLTLFVWFIMFYMQLPPINIQSKEFWAFFVMAIAIAVLINMWNILKGFSFIHGEPENANKLKRFKKIIYVIGALAAVYIAGNILSSPILRSGAYRQLLTVEQSDFSTDIQEVDYSQIPILDKDSAAKLSERKMGSMIDMVSQYEVSDYYTQINYQQKPVRVTPLKYGDEIKWLTNRKTGIPAYIRIDMTTQDVELIKLEEGIKISPSEHFSRDLMRYLRFRYPTEMFYGVNFEIDDAGEPYWICPVVRHSIGLFGGLDVKGAVVLNAVTGEHQYYNVEDIPQWIDVVYDAGLLIEQYNYFGRLVNGYINSIFGQRGCLQSTEGYNYIALNDDVWVYTGVTSVGGDESNVGFVLMNQRTKQTKYYAVSGAKEVSAMSSAEGQVQHLGYRATFPLLINISDEPTYFLALKDSAGLVKKYAMVNIEKYQIVAIGDSVVECEKAYRNLMNNSGIETNDVTKALSIEGSITLLKDIIIDGNTYYYIMISGSDDLFEIEVKNILEAIKLKEGISVKLEYLTTSAEGLNSVIGIE